MEGETKKIIRHGWKVKHPIYAGGRGNVFAWVASVCMCAPEKALSGSPPPVFLLHRIKTP